DGGGFVVADEGVAATHRIGDLQLQHVPLRSAGCAIGELHCIARRTCEFLDELGQLGAQRAFVFHLACDGGVRCVRNRILHQKLLGNAGTGEAKQHGGSKQSEFVHWISPGWWSIADNIGGIAIMHAAARKKKPGHVAPASLIATICLAAGYICGAGPPMVAPGVEPEEPPCLGGRALPLLDQSAGGPGSRPAMISSIWPASMVSYCSSASAIAWSLSRLASRISFERA